MKEDNSLLTEKPKAISLFEEHYGLNLIMLFEEDLTETPFDSFTINNEGNIVEIQITYSKIKNIAKLIELFPNLERLDISRNSIEDIQLISNLKKLKRLICNHCGIRNIEFVSNLFDLEELDLDFNSITNINPLTNLHKLQILHLSFNHVSDIAIISNVKSLKKIGLLFNQIKVIPFQLAKDFQWLKNSDHSYTSANRISLLHNPLQYPPISVIELGPITVEDYYKTSEKFGHEPLSEGRVIFVGDGSAGKSSLIEKTLYNTFEKGRTQTNGIHIEHFQLNHPEDNRELNFHIWDFGGQEIQHAVHKFFFTEGCLYVLVLDNRKEEDPEYWLQQIESLGGKAAVLVVFNKQDENTVETVDRKYLKEKYPNIIDFYKTSCVTEYGISDFRDALEKEVVKLRTVDEQFPKNWLAIKKSIEEMTSGSQHYLTFETYKQLCIQNQTDNEAAQKLLLKYFNTIGAVTWFGDVNLTMMHVLNPKWITQGVYKIITSKKTARLLGQISISDFKELLQPIEKDDYTYDESHYAYILNMMKKFELCDSPDDVNLLIPSAFGKEPKLEYKDFKGNNITTYVLQFKDYLPLALIHRYTTKNISQALDNNYWYSGIVVKDRMSEVLAMVHADKLDKRIYIRIKGENKLGLWEHIRREFAEIASSYAKIKYDEIVAVDEREDSYVNYEDLISHLQAKKNTYFHPKLKKDFNVGYLLGFFETKSGTIEKIQKGKIKLKDHGIDKIEKMPNFVLQILNNNSPNINTSINTQITIDIDIQIVNEIGSKVQGEVIYLLEELNNSNSVLCEALNKLIVFLQDAKSANNKSELISKGWARKLKSIVSTIAEGGKQIKNINDGGLALANILNGVKDLACQFNFSDIIQIIDSIPKTI